MERRFFLGMIPAIAVIPNIKLDIKEPKVKRPGWYEFKIKDVTEHQTKSGEVYYRLHPAGRLLPQIIISPRAPVHALNVIRSCGIHNTGSTFDLEDLIGKTFKGYLR